MLDKNEMVDKDFCLSSYIAFRYIWKDGVTFFEGMDYKNYELPGKENQFLVSGAIDIDKYIQEQIAEIYASHENIGVLLSGGMDSAIVASYLKPGSHAYTFISKDSSIYDEDLNRARYYSEKLGLEHHLVEIGFDDYEAFSPVVMGHKGAPVHSIEPQIYKAAIQSKNDGVNVMLIGDGADYVFGGMDKLLSRDWTFNDFVERYMLIDPKKVLAKSVDMTGLFEPYRIADDKIDFVSFLKGPVTIESYGSYKNAFDSAGVEYYDPYERMKMAEDWDLARIRQGESKYYIRELFKMRFPEIRIPEKIPMPRPVDEIFKNWNGPVRPEFRSDIEMDRLTGNQKWQLWCAEKFLNEYD